MLSQKRNYPPADQGDVIERTAQRFDEHLKETHSGDGDKLHWGRLLIAEDQETMFALLRAELKAIVEWDRKTLALRSQTEMTL